MAYAEICYGGGVIFLVKNAKNTINLGSLGACFPGKCLESNPKK